MYARKKKVGHVPSNAVNSNFLYQMSCLPRYGPTVPVSWDMMRASTTLPPGLLLVAAAGPAARPGTRWRPVPTQKPVPNRKRILIFL